ncbi:MAG TPA: DNA polymerase III subunit delta [Bryobacteraceae bacterium]|nr:DNA polymerase III subunit delta [Bryobacteraceae bacterium]
MSPEQFLQRIRGHATGRSAAGRPAEPAGRTSLASSYLFLGSELYQLGRCREALIERVLGRGGRENGLERYDLEETPLATILDDARSLSLFATERVIWVSSAEAALPKGRAATAEEGAPAGALAEYVRHPTPGTVLVFESSRYDFDGEDRARLERVQKFFSAIPDVVEFRPYTLEAARALAQDLAKDAGLDLGLSEIDLLVDSLGADAGRIGNEIEKLRLYAGANRKITADDILRLVPNAQASNLFALVAAIGRGDRKRSLLSLDTLLREGEYLPLALTFLATQFRLAMVAHEAGLRGAQQIQTYFTGQGIRMWRDRAEQVNQTLAAFPGEKLARAIERVFSADKALRDTRPDDRVVMEELVFNLTS